MLCSQPLFQIIVFCILVVILICTSDQEILPECGIVILGTVLFAWMLMSQRDWWSKSCVILTLGMQISLECCNVGHAVVTFSPLCPSWDSGPEHLAYIWPSSGYVAITNCFQPGCDVNENLVSLALPNVSWMPSWCSMLPPAWTWWCGTGLSLGKEASPGRAGVVWMTVEVQRADRLIMWYFNIHWQLILRFEVHLYGN